MNILEKRKQAQTQEASRAAPMRIAVGLVMIVACAIAVLLHPAGMLLTFICLSIPEVGLGIIIESLCTYHKLPRPVAPVVFLAVTPLWVYLWLLLMKTAV